MIDGNAHRNFKKPEGGKEILSMVERVVGTIHTYHKRLHKRTFHPSAWSLDFNWIYIREICPSFSFHVEQNSLRVLTSIIPYGTP